MIVCPSCATELPEGSRFCLSCGVPLAAPAAAAEERKVVTTLFCDLVGFTAMSESADPEDLDALLRAYHAAARKVVEAGRGQGGAGLVQGLVDLGGQGLVDSVFDLGGSKQQEQGGTAGGAGVGQARADERREGLRRSQGRSYSIPAPLQWINVLETWSRWAAQSRPMVLRAVATLATPAGLERERRL